MKDRFYVHQLSADDAYHQVWAPRLCTLIGEDDSITSDVLRGFRSTQATAGTNSQTMNDPSFGVESNAVIHGLSQLKGLTQRRIMPLPLGYNHVRVNSSGRRGGSPENTRKQTCMVRGQIAVSTGRSIRGVCLADGTNHRRAP